MAEKRPPRPEPIALARLFLRLAGVPSPWEFGGGRDTLRELGIEKECDQFVRVALLAYDLVTAHREDASDEWKAWLRLTTWNETNMRRVVFLNIVRNARSVYLAGKPRDAAQQLVVEAGALGVDGLERLSLDDAEHELRRYRGKGYTAAARLSLSVGAFGDVADDRRRKVSDIRRMKGDRPEAQAIRFEEIVADRFAKAEEDTQKPPMHRR